MKVLDLFSGLGMFSYAARNVFQENFKSAGFVEIDKYCQKQILDFFEGATIYDNIETFEPGEENKADYYSIRSLRLNKHSFALHTLNLVLILVPSFFSMLSCISYLLSLFWIGI